MTDRAWVDTEAACLYTGRSKWCLYKWAREGRVSTRKLRGRVEWDVFELPARQPDGTLLPPPPKRS